MTFNAVQPIDGSIYGSAIHENTESEVRDAISRAKKVAKDFATLSPQSTSALLRAIADSIEGKREALVASACAETGLPEGRIGGEITRTTVQFKLFANLVETGRHLKVVIDKADPNYSPAPRPDIRRQNQPLGVIAIFAASNFPLAFSVAGGDAASALASGNPVVAKGHPAHPHTCAIVESAVKEALKKCALSEDLFTVVQGVNPQITHWLASNPDIQAIGFTGSEAVGRILIKISSEREVPIPVFAEMGSLNPVFITQGAITERSAELAQGLVDSALLGSGQFCTKPGLVFVPKSATGFLDEIAAHLATLKVGPLLSASIAERYSKAITQIASSGAVKVLSGLENEAGFGVTPTLFITDWVTAQKNHELLEEHFGPTSVIITADETDYVAIAEKLQGQLTATIQGAASDKVSALLSILAERAGRVIWNGFPTGVAVTEAMQHGGPWPSSSTHTTSVGIDAIYRFVRPVAYQSFAQDVLPPALQDSNPWKVEQTIN
jgi:acyl-CoA reductase-like NAD-dependent aldehyde dehydrogenase